MIPTKPWVSVIPKAIRRKLRRRGLSSYAARVLRRIPANVDVSKLTDGQQRLLEIVRGLR